MATNTFFTTQLVAREALAAFQDNCPFLATGSRGYEKEFMQGPYKKGDTLQIRRQNQYIIGDGSTMVPQDINEAVESLVLNHQYHAGIELTTKQSTLQLEDFRQAVLRPAIQEMISKFESDIGVAAETQLNYFVPGVSTSLINSFASVDLAGAGLLELGVPLDTEAYIAMSVRDGSALKAGLLPNFTPVYNEDIVRNSAIGHVSYFDAFQSQKIAVHTAGVGPRLFPGDTLLVNGTVSSGNTIVLSGATVSQTDYFLPGDIISIGGVQSVDPNGRTPTGTDMQFVITAAANSTAGGAVTITVSPSIISDVTNSRRNVSNAVPNGSEVTTISTHRVNVAYIPRALDIICPPLDRLEVRQCTVETDPRTGISIRVSTQGDIYTDVNVMRIDVLCGFLWHQQYALKVPSKPTN